ncbi:hypothetical protein [Paenibacillus sinopodophylli]|uniref:hypothetical protein n=1 Tax=Paenibacillus sinopodophylli TaxID=1837342 RepID=UPI00110C9645|nr:hypothetical protein [Paenibacillus sinopodophylli]
MSIEFGIIRIIWCRERCRRQDTASDSCVFIGIILTVSTAGMMQGVMTGDGLLRGTRFRRVFAVLPAMMQGLSRGYNLTRGLLQRWMSWGVLLRLTFMAVFMKWGRVSSISLN